MWYWALFKHETEISIKIFFPRKLSCFGYMGWKSFFLFIYFSFSSPEKCIHLEKYLYWESLNPLSQSSGIRVFDISNLFGKKWGKPITATMPFTSSIINETLQTFTSIRYWKGHCLWGYRRRNPHGSHHFFFVDKKKKWNGRYWISKQRLLCKSCIKKSKKEANEKNKDHWFILMFFIHQKRMTTSIQKYLSSALLTIIIIIEGIGIADSKKQKIWNVYPFHATNKPTDSVTLTRFFIKGLGRDLLLFGTEGRVSWEWESETQLIVPVLSFFNSKKVKPTWFSFLFSGFKWNPHHHVDFI